MAKPLAFAFPILAGKTEALRKFAKPLSGPKSKEFDAFQKRFKTDKETWFLQSSPQGDMVIVYFESKDPVKVMGDFVASKHPFDVWYKDEVKEISGVDMNKPSGEPLPEQVFKYRY